MRREWISDDHRNGAQWEDGGRLRLDVAPDTQRRADTDRADDDIDRGGGGGGGFRSSIQYIATISGLVLLMPRGRHQKDVGRASRLI